MYPIFALFACSIYLCASALFYALSLALSLSAFALSVSFIAAIAINFVHFPILFTPFVVCASVEPFFWLFVSFPITFLALTLTPTDLPCALHVPGEILSCVAGRQASRGGGAAGTRACIGGRGHSTPLTHFRLRFASFCLVSFDCRRLRRTLSMMGNDGLTLTETLLFYTCPLTSIRSCLPACLAAWLPACVSV